MTPAAAAAIDHDAARVLVARPRHQQAAFCHRLRQHGLEAISYPCLAIQPTQHFLPQASLQNFTLALFTSRNAVDHAARQHPLPWPVPVQGIGPATEHALAVAGQPVAAPAAPPFDSETWLQRLDGAPTVSRILIVTGEGGRDALAGGLRERGVPHEVWTTYRRVLPHIDPDVTTDIFTRRPPSLITLTSDEAMRNLRVLSGTHFDSLLRHLPLVVNSERSATLAAALGFTRVARIARPPGDDGQMAAIIAWLADGGASAN